MMYTELNIQHCMAPCLARSNPVPPAPACLIHAIMHALTTPPPDTNNLLPARFDMNSGSVRRKFSHVFTRESPSGPPDDIATPSITLTGSSTRAAAGASAVRNKDARRRGTPVERNVTGCRRALFALDPKNANGTLFLVLQLSKVLQGEPEKVRCGKGGGGVKGETSV